MRYLLAGIGIGAGIAIGIAGMNIMGKVAYNAADTIITAGAIKIQSMLKVKMKVNFTS